MSLTGMVCPRCKVKACDILQHTRGPADKIVWPCCIAANSVCRGSPRPRIRLHGDRAFDMRVDRISIPSYKADRSEVLQTSTAGSSVALCRKYSAFQPRMGISDTPRRPGGTGVQPEGDCTSSEVEYMGTYIEEVACHMAGEDRAASDRRHTLFPQRWLRGTSCNCLDGRVAHRSVFGTSADAHTS